MSYAPLLLTIRFTSTQPDLELDIPSPGTTTVLSLKHTLRARLATRSRIILLANGRLLPDTSSLVSTLQSLRSLSPPPESNSKGKAPERTARRIFLHCSLGDELSTAEIDAEAAGAEKPPEDVEQPEVETRARPRGFDRLLEAGFTASEVTTLRAQFATIHAERFSPDEVPSPDTLRGMEDAWIDSNATREETAMGEEDVHGMAAVVDVMVKAMMVGFFFPLGSITWLMRMGMWNEKWTIFVASGVFLSLTVGIITNISRE